jgi:hypothetical protein
VDLQRELLKELANQGLDVADGYLHWNCLPFGWQSSPYLALHMLACGLEIATHDPSDQMSAFSFSQMVLNLPCMNGYDPGSPRVCQIWVDG